MEHPRMPQDTSEKGEKEKAKEEVEIQFRDFLWAIYTELCVTCPSSVLATL